MITNRSATTPNLLPVSISNDPYSAFYSGGGLLVRVVTAGELPQEWLCRPISILQPGSTIVISQGGFNQFERGPDRVVTILKPNKQLTLLWSFKQDVGSDSEGEPCISVYETGSAKKMTDPDMLREKMGEQKLREGSIFLPYTSGHINCDGFRLHKHASPRRETDVYPELICHLKPRQMHGGYLLDPKREASFERIAETMANILAMENANGNGNSDAFQEPVTLCMYDSYRGLLLPPEKLDRATVEKIQANANALCQYERSIGMEGKLYGLLAQSGCGRFLSLLKEIPDTVKKVAEAGTTFPVSELEKAIELMDADRFHELLLSIDETLLNQIGLPDHLLSLLLQRGVIPAEEFYAAGKAEQFLLEHIDRHRLNSLMTDTFPKQAKICRTLLKHGLFYPLIGFCQYRSATNPLVVCLLIAHGARADFSPAWKMERLGVPSLLYSANEFLKAGLLTEEEVERIRCDVLLGALCFGENGVLEHNQIRKNFTTLALQLYEFFYEMPTAGKPSTEDHNQIDKQKKADRMCCELFGKELWYSYCCNDDDGARLRMLWERGLSPQRYSDEELRQHLNLLTVSKPAPYSFQCIVHHLGTYVQVYNRAVIRAVGSQGKDADWLSSLLATPPDFDRCEFTRVGRLRAITQTAGQHYYQYHHPNSAANIATKGVDYDYVHRQYHGIDHALRTQMATEFLIEILPSYHKPFRQLLATYPDLPELLKIAELYHDAVAEDEPKNTEELRAAELFERDMRSLHEYPDGLITLVATALRNKNSNEMSPVQTLFTADDQCSPEELLLRQVLRFGDVVDMLRLLPLPKNFLEVKNSFATDPVSAPREPDKFDPQAIELLTVINNPLFTRMIKAALLTFRDLAALTGGWHLKSNNPPADRYQLQVDNQQRRLLVEHSPAPYTLMRDVLDDLVRLEIAKRAGISSCLDQDGHRDYAENGSTPSCWDWDKATGVAGTYRKLHSEVELRQVRVPKEMTLTEKVHFVSELELPAADRPFISFDIRTTIGGEINRLRQEGIQPATGTPSQDELQQMYEWPDSIGACILAERGIVVRKAEHDGRTYFRMVKSHDSRSQDIN